MIMPDPKFPQFEQENLNNTESNHNSVEQIPSQELIVNKSNPEVTKNLSNHQFEGDVRVEIKKTSSETDIKLDNPSLKRIEKILESNLVDIYLQMPSELQIQFKQKGEAISSQILQLISLKEVNSKEVQELISDWLHLVPTMNEFFIQQEAKLKTDELIQYKIERDSMRSFQYQS